MIKQPFIYGHPVDGINFIDREKEAKQLFTNFQLSRNSIIVSARRIGKTSLVKKVASKALDQRLKIVYVDIFSCRSETDFYRVFADEVLRQLSSGTDELMKNAMTYLSNLAPQICLGNGSKSEISLTFAVKPTSKDMESILILPELMAQRYNMKVRVIIDEFQQVGEFPESITFQKGMRSVWQQMENVSFCFCGSKVHMMSEMFGKSRFPLYQFGDFISLSKIEEKHWISYISGRFKTTSKFIYDEHASKICKLVENYSCYVQELAWLVWINTEGFTSDDIIMDSYEELLHHCSPLFQQLTLNLTTYQMNFIKAVVMGYGETVSGQDTIAKFELGSSANVCRIKESLTKQELIEIQGKKVLIPDPVFREWIKREFT